MTETVMFFFGFVASAAIFYNIGVIRTQRKYLDEVINISLMKDYISTIERLENLQ